jgi:hypothetical protein
MVEVEVTESFETSIYVTRLQCVTYQQTASRDACLSCAACQKFLSKMYKRKCLSSSYDSVLKEWEVRLMQSYIVILLYNEPLKVASILSDRK